MTVRPEPDARIARASMVRRGIGLGAGAAVAVLLILGLVVAPPDAVQGQAQRLMYLHVPAAWVAFLSFAVVLAASVGYLWRRELRWDIRAQAAAEIGTGLTALTIALGALWGRPVWGVWWAWDPRMVSTAVLLLIYAGYLGVRGLSADPHVNARRAAVIGVLGFAEVPIVYFSVLWWRGLHQPPTLLDPGGASPIAAPMLAALLVGVAAFTLLAAWVYLRRLAQLTARAASTGPGHPGAGGALATTAAAVHVHAGGSR